jgi:hypothetical protein
MKRLKSAIYVFVLLFNLQSLHCQIRHLVVIDASGLYDPSIKSITPLVDSCKTLLGSFKDKGEEFVLVVCNDNNPLVVKGSDDFSTQLDKIFEMDPNVPTPVETIRNVIDGLDDSSLSKGSFTLHYFSSLTNLFSGSYNHYSLIVMGLSGILEQELDRITSQNIYISQNDRNLNEEYFKQSRKLVQTHLYK